MFNFFAKSDSQIQQDVMNEIKWDPSLQSSQVMASTHDGIVSLSGSVTHFYERSQAERAAQRVGGVRAVVDQIEVNMMGSYVYTDQQIAESALTALKASYSVPKDVKVAVEKGWITLSGESEWDYQRKAAKDAVGQLMGVCGVKNNILIKSKTLPSDIQTRIEQALKRSAESEGRKISVSISGDIATLTGNVHSISEMQDAGHAAWMAPGIMSVENHLKISN
jgi:osmotically-inducible protein OsmY